MSIILYFALTILVMCGIFLGIKRLDTQDLLPPIICSDAIVWKKASGAPSNKITEAWEIETEKSGCNDTFTCAI